MTLAIETHQLTRYFDKFCAVNAIDLSVEHADWLRAEKELLAETQKKTKGRSKSKVTSIAA